MKLGQQALEALQAEITGKIYPGDDLVVAGETGISGTLELICREWDKLRTYFSESFLRMGVETLKLYDFRKKMYFGKKLGFLHCILQRTVEFLSGLWKNGRSFWSWYGCRSSQNSNPAGDDRSL